MILDSQNNKHLFFFYFLIYVTIYFTNSHFSLHETFLMGGADGKSYMIISQSAPYITLEEITPIHSERFFFPYLIGIVAKLFNIQIFFFYKIVVFIVLFLINYFLIRILKIIKLENNFIIILIALVNFNPYFSRFYIAIPTIVNDLIFILGTTIIFLNILKKDKINIFFAIGLILAFASRQTSLAYLVAYLITIIICKKRIFNLKIELIALSIFVLLLFLSYFYSSHTFSEPSTRSNLYSFEMRIMGIFFQDISFENKIIFLLLPFLSYGLILIYFILFMKIKIRLKDLIESKLLIFLSSFIFLLILQPILSGPEITGKNIIRLTTLSIVPVIILLSLISIKKKKLLSKKKLLYLFMLLAFIHSLHPTFSNITIFNSLRF